MLKSQSKKAFFLNLMPKREQNYSPLPSIFKSREGNCPQLFRPWSGISEVRTADIFHKRCIPKVMSIIWITIFIEVITHDCVFIFQRLKKYWKLWKINVLFFLNVKVPLATVRIFSCLCVSVFSFLVIRICLSAI
jgi:hypothetical protein